MPYLLSSIPIASIPGVAKIAFVDIGCALAGTVVAAAIATALLVVQKFKRRLVSRHPCRLKHDNVKDQRSWILFESRPGKASYNGVPLVRGAAKPNLETSMACCHCIGLAAVALPPMPYGLSSRLIPRQLRSGTMKVPLLCILPAIMAYVLSKSCGSSSTHALLPFTDEIYMEEVRCFTLLIRGQVPKF
jgi:hypothetical protein